MPGKIALDQGGHTADVPDLLELAGIEEAAEGALREGRAALRERSYSAVMAATGLLYLAILTAFGTDLVARAVLSG